MTKNNVNIPQKIYTYKYINIWMYIRHNHICADNVVFIPVASETIQHEVLLVLVNTWFFLSTVYIHYMYVYIYIYIYTYVCVRM